MIKRSALKVNQKRDNFSINSALSAKRRQRRGRIILGSLPHERVTPDALRHRGLPTFLSCLQGCSMFIHRVMGVPFCARMCCILRTTFFYHSKGTIGNRFQKAVSPFRPEKRRYSPSACFFTANKPPYRLREKRNTVGGKVGVYKLSSDRPRQGVAEKRMCENVRF